MQMLDVAHEIRVNETCPNDVGTDFNPLTAIPRFLVEGPARVSILSSVQHASGSALPSLMHIS